MVAKKGTEAYEQWKGSDSYKTFIKNKTGKNSPRFRKDITKDILHQKYIIEKKPSTKIAKELNTGAGLIWKRLKQYGIPIRTRSEVKKGENHPLYGKTGKNSPQFRKDITKDILNQKYVIEKKSSCKIAKELNISATQIRKRLNQYGIPIRTASESSKERLKDKKNHPNYGKTPLSFRKEILKDIIYKKYTTEKKSSLKIAKELNISTSLVYGRLKRYKIQIRTNSEALKGKQSWIKGLTKETDERVRKMSEENSGKNNYMYGKKHTEKSKRKISKLGLKRFKDEEWVKKWAKAMNIKPNKPELFLQNILNKHHPNEWKYVGDFKFMLGGKNPDFMNCNGKKLLIELYGDYWHRNDTEEDIQNRINHFKQFGFDTLIIWERELKNQEKMLEKIGEFIA